MKTPRFFLGSALIFWGWLVNLLWAAAPLAVVLEGAGMMKTRFDLTADDVNKFVDVSTVLLAGTIVAALAVDAQNANLILLKWVPAVLFPIIAAQELSAQGRIEVRSFFLAARKKTKIQYPESDTIDVSYLYGLICLMSAGSANTKGMVFFLALLCFMVWGAWQIRSKRVSPVLWVGGLLMMVIAGFAGQKTVHVAGKQVSNWIMSYYADYWRSDPFRAYTSLGEIGELKVFDKIVMRVGFDEKMPGSSMLLHMATYNRFAVSNWFANFGFEPVESVEDGAGNPVWQVNPLAENSMKMTVYSRLSKGKAVLSLPSGVTTISDMKAAHCEKNAMQVVRIEDGPSLVKATVSYTGISIYDKPPYTDDLLVPVKERPVLASVAEQLQLNTKSDPEILQAVHGYFLTEFTYSLDLKGGGRRMTPIESFLTRTRAGHCEFFATATVLLLREAGIPARYVTGFVVHEYSDLENRYIVRSRDAHAWARVFVNGQWRNFDTTPPDFQAIDRLNSGTSRLSDLFSFIGFKLSQLRHETGAKLMETYGLWLLLPLVILLFLRLKKAGSIRRVAPATKAGHGTRQDAMGVSLYRIEAELARKGFPRHPYETYASWLKRIGHHFRGEENLSASLHAVLVMHNLWRFGRSGLTDAEERKLFADAAALTQKISAIF